MLIKSGVTQTSASVSTDTVLQSSVAGFGSSPLACENTTVAGVTNQVVPGSGSLVSPPFTAGDTAFGLPQLLSSKLPNQPPLYTLKVGISNPMSDAVGMGSEEGNIEGISVVSSLHAEGLENTKPTFTKSAHDFVGDLSKTWGNSKDWMLELWDGRKIVIPLSAYCSPESVPDQPALEGVVYPGLASLFKEGQIVSWVSECDGVGCSVVSEVGLEGEVWGSNEGLLAWEQLGEPLEVAPLAMDNLVVTKIPTAEEIGCKADVDNTKLSQWVTNRIKAFQKFVGTSLEGFEEQVTSLLLALEAQRKQRMIDVASKEEDG